MTARGAGLALATALLLGTAASAASLPPWAQALADAAPALPEGVPKTRARVLLAEDVLTVQPDGTFRVRRRIAMQALKTRSEGVGIAGFDFQEGAKIHVSKAWHLPPEGKAAKSRGPEVDVSIDDAFVTDSRVRLVGVDGVKKGSLVFFEFEAEHRPHLFGYRHLFLEDGPVDLARFVLELPEGWGVRSSWLRGGAPEVEAGARRRVWQLTDLPDLDEEPWGERAVERAPTLVLAILPPEGSTHAAKAAADWPAFARWFERVAEGTDKATEAVVRAAETAASTAAAPAESCLALASHVRDRVRYVAQAIGIGGYRPRPAPEVLETLHGDCKDKGTLLRAMLASRGIASYPLLVSATRWENVSEEIPDLAAFDHLVIGAAIPPDTKIDATLAHSVAEAEGIGRLLVLDATHEYLEPGGIPGYLAGKRALVVAGEKSRLVTLPAGTPDAHRVERDLKIDLGGDGSASLALTSRYHGESAVEPTAAWRISSVDRRREVANAVARRWIGAVVGEYRAETGTKAAPFVEEISWKVASLPGGAIDSFFPGVCEEIPRLPLSRRELPVVFRHPFGVTYRTEVTGAAPDLPLPKGDRKIGPGFAIETAFEKADGKVVARFDLDVEGRRYEKAAFDELKALWTACSRAAGSGVVR